MTRFQHVQFDEENKKRSKSCRLACIALETEIEKLPVSREKNIALTHLEECFMWVNKALKEMQIDRTKDLKPTMKQAVVIRKVAQT